MSTSAMEQQLLRAILTDEEPMAILTKPMAILTDEELELRKLGRVMAFLHECFHRGYDVDIIHNFLDPNFIKTPCPYWTTHRLIVFVLKVAVLLLSATLSPYIYAQFVMAYPCKPREERLGRGTTAAEVTLKIVGCEAQDTIRSPLLLLAVPCALLIALLVFKLTKIVDMAAWKCYPEARYLPGEFLIAFAEKKLLPITASKLARVKYASSYLYILACAIYFILLLEFAIISAFMKTAVSALVGYAIAQLFLAMASSALSPGQEYIAKVQGHIACWPEDGDARAQGVLQRLAQQRGGRMIYATIAELNSLATLEKLCKAVACDEQTLRDYQKSNERVNADKCTIAKRVGFYRKERGWYFRNIHLNRPALWIATKVYVASKDLVIDLLEPN